MLRDVIGSSAEADLDASRRWALTVVRASAAMGAVVAASGLLVLALVLLGAVGATGTMVWVGLALIVGGGLWGLTHVLLSRWLVGVGEAGQLGLLSLLASVAAGMVSHAVGVLTQASTGWVLFACAAVLAGTETALVGRVTRQVRGQERAFSGRSYDLESVLRVVVLGSSVLGGVACLVLGWTYMMATAAIDEDWNSWVAFFSGGGLVVAALWTVPHLVLLMWAGVPSGPVIVGAVIGGVVLVILGSTTLWLAALVPFLPVLAVVLVAVEVVLVVSVRSGEKVR